MSLQKKLVESHFVLSCIVSKKNWNKEDKGYTMMLAMYLLRLANRLILGLSDVNNNNAGELGAEF